MGAVIVPIRRERPERDTRGRVAEHMGRRLRRRRRLVGLTQIELAQAAGLPFEDIQKFETATAELPASHLRRLAEALLAPISYFYDGLEDEPGTITA